MDVCLPRAANVFGRRVRLETLDSIKSETALAIAQRQPAPHWQTTATKSDGVSGAAAARATETAG